MGANSRPEDHKTPSLALHQLGIKVISAIRYISSLQTQVFTLAIKKPPSIRTEMRGSETQNKLIKVSYEAKCIGQTGCHIKWPAHKEQLQRRHVHIFI